MQIILSIILSLLFFSSHAYADTEKFVYTYDFNGSIIKPLNPASVCPDPAGDNEPAKECLGVAVDEKGKYRVRLASSDLNEKNLLFIVKEYQVIPKF